MGVAERLSYREALLHQDQDQVTSELRGKRAEPVRRHHARPHQHLPPLLHRRPCPRRASRGKQGGHGGLWRPCLEKVRAGYRLYGRAAATLGKQEQSSSQQRNKGNPPNLTEQT